jgi:hypothetical protein
VRILPDECLPRRLKRDLTGHDVRTVPEMGWASKENGDLISKVLAVLSDVVAGHVVKVTS